jgi:hypothetical protein
MPGSKLALWVRKNCLKERKAIKDNNLLLHLLHNNNERQVSSQLSPKMNLIASRLLL